MKRRDNRQTQLRIMYIMLTHGCVRVPDIYTHLTVDSGVSRLLIGFDSFFTKKHLLWTIVTRRIQNVVLTVFRRVFRTLVTKDDEVIHAGIKQERRTTGSHLCRCRLENLFVC